MGGIGNDAAKLRVLFYTLKEEDEEEEEEEEEEQWWRKKGQKTMMNGRKWNKWRQWRRRSRRHLGRKFRDVFECAKSAHVSTMV